MKPQIEIPPPGGHARSAGLADRRRPSLQDAVAALPESASGHLSRDQMQRLAEAGDARACLRRCLDELSLVRGLVEVLRVAATEAEAPIRDTRNGIDALADLVRDQLGRLQVLL